MSAKRKKPTPAPELIEFGLRCMAYGAVVVAAYEVGYMAALATSMLKMMAGAA